MELYETDVYLNWLNNLRDLQARDRIVNRVRRLMSGNPGDVRSEGAGVSEMRIDYGPGYRVYYWQRGDILVVLLAGGERTPKSGTSRGQLTWHVKRAIR